MAAQPRNTLPKEERLSGKRSIDLLYEKGQSFIAYPLRVVYLLPEDSLRPVGVSMMVRVAKKKIRKAFRRNYVKRQVREAYRVRKHELTASLTERGQSMLLAFAYLDNELHSFSEIEKAMTKALKKLIEKK
jgi:ribonuclease P protein component